MIQDVDETLRRLLQDELPRVNPLWQQVPVRIAFDNPAEVKTGPEPRVNLYLHDVRENTALRADESLMRVRPQPAGAGQDREPSGDRLVGLQRPPVRLNLSYLITAYGGAEGANGADKLQAHTLLSDVLRILLRYRVIPAAYLTDSLKISAGAKNGSDESGLPIAVAQPDSDALKDPAVLWRSLGGSVQPALGLVVLAAMQPFETVWARRVREIVFGFAPSLPKNGEPFRPVDLAGIRVSAAGIVLGGSGGAASVPLEGARVTLIESPGTSVRTDAQGFWSLLDLRPGACRARVEQFGFATREIAFEAPPLGRPDLVPLLATALSPVDRYGQAEQGAALAAGGAPAVIESRRSRSITLSGVLRYPDGRPAAFVPVRAGRWRTVTDATGFYGLYDLPESAEAQWRELVAEIPGTGEVALTPLSLLIADPSKKGAAKREAETVPLPGTALTAGEIATKTT